VTWLAWLLAALFGGALIGLSVSYARLSRDLEAVRQVLAAERSSHYVTWRRLGRREQRLGAMIRQLEGLREIAQSSAQLAQIYEPLMATAQWTDSEPMPISPPEV
jgi:predicted Zn-dependent protease